MAESFVSVIVTCLKDRIANAVAKGLNSKIQQVKSAARGFRNFDNDRIVTCTICRNWRRPNSQVP